MEALDWIILAVVFVVFRLLLAGIVVGGLWLRGRMTPASPEQQELRTATRAYKAAVKAARRALSAAQREHKRGVKRAQVALSQAQRIGARRLGSYKGKNGKVVLHELRLATPYGTVDLYEDRCRAVVGTAGTLARTQRTSLTRMAVGGLVAGAWGAVAGGLLQKGEVHDTRELYLLIESRRLRAIIPCDPDDGLEVRELAVRIETAARNAKDVWQRRTAAVQAASAALDAARQDTSGLEAGRRELVRVQADTARLDAARTAVASTGPRRTGGG